MPAKTLPKEPVCEGLVIQVGTFTDDDKAALSLARKVAARNVPGKLLVKALGPGSRDFLIAPASGRPLATARAWDLTAKLKQDRDVAAAEPSFLTAGVEPPATALPQSLTGAELAVASFGADAPLPCSAANDWSLAFAHVRDAWKVALPSHGQGKRFGEGIVIGHPDTGYTKHVQIFSVDPAVNRLLIAKGRNFFEGKADPADSLAGFSGGHGTGTASVIMSDAEAAGTTAAFVAGVAPKAQLVPMRVTDTVILMSYRSLTEALNFAAQQGHHVVSISLGGPIPSGFLHRAVEAAVAKGVVVLAAAGNVWPFVVFPARLEKVIAVAAANCQGKIWSKSAHGSDVDVTAPGESVWVARPGEKPGTEDDFIERSSGTSHAVATTAGACALWLAHHGRDRLIAKYGAGRLAAVFKEVLMTAGVDTPTGWRKDEHGAGLLNVKKLLEAPLPATPNAAGMALFASAGPIPGDPLVEILPFFPGVSRTAVTKGLKRFLNSSDAELPGVLAEHHDELLFHIGTDPGVRGQIAGAAAPAGGAGLAAAAAKALPARPSRLGKTASAAFRARVAAGE